jgi:hypothetical protein
MTDSKHVESKFIMPSIRSKILNSIKNIVAIPDSTLPEYRAETQALWSEYVYFSAVEPTTWTEDLPSQTKPSRK